MTFHWNEENIATLTRMWRTHSASQIQDEIGCPSRSAVIGKAHRLGLGNKAPGRVNNWKGAQASSQRSTHKNSLGASFGLPKLKAEKIKAAPPAPPESLRVPLFDVPVGGCKFAVTGHDVAAHEHLFCGVKADGVYCPYHAELAYTPYADRRREKAKAKDKRNFVQRSSNPDRFNAAWR